MGGLELVISRKQWVIVCEPFNFPSSFTNKSFVMKKLYVNALHHYEQVSRPYIHEITPDGISTSEEQAQMSSRMSGETCFAARACSRAVLMSSESARLNHTFVV